jgi:succinylglutamate desuccinylase
LHLQMHTHISHSFLKSILLLPFHIQVWKKMLIHFLHYIISCLLFCIFCVSVFSFFIRIYL